MRRYDATTLLAPTTSLVTVRSTALLHALRSATRACHREHANHLANVQMTFYVDGFVLDRNPSPRGGGFTVVNERNEHIITHNIMRAGFTNNDGELLAIGYAAFIAHPGDVIITDSQPAMWWVKTGLPKKRPDLRKYAQRIHDTVRTKRLNVVWKPREENLAGHHNETMERP